MYFKQENWILNLILGQVFLLLQIYAAVKEDIPIYLNKCTLFFCMCFNNNVLEKCQSSGKRGLPFFLLDKCSIICSNESIHVTGLQSCNRVNSYKGHGADQFPNYLIQRLFTEPSMDISTLYIAVAHIIVLQNMTQIQLKSHVNIFPCSQAPANICGLSVRCVWFSTVLTQPCGFQSVPKLGRICSPLLRMCAETYHVFNHCTV